MRTRRCSDSLVILSGVNRRNTRDSIADELRYQSEERFRLLVESVKDYALFMLDCDGYVASWNAGAERITGYAASEAIGVHFSCFYTEEARETRWPEHQLAVAARDGRFEEDAWRFGKGGERFWAHNTITALRDAEGTLRGFANVIRDLSERRRQEEQVAQNEERLRALLSHVRDYAIYMLDPNGIVVSWGDGAQRIKGYRAEEIIGAHFSRVYPREAIERGWPEHELRVAATEGHFEDEGWRVRKDGSRFWADVVITALRDRNSKLIGFSQITRDLTERRRSEAALRQSEERFRQLIESVHDYAIYMLDPSGQVMSWNGGAQRITGFEAAEILGKHFSRFYSPEEIRAGAPWQQLEAAHLHGRFEVEGLRVRKDGTAFCAQVVILPVYDAEGLLQGYSHITHDQTQFRHMRALEESSRHMNEFLAVLSHELRNPLAPIRHAVAWMKRQPHPDRLVETARDIIDHQVSHLTRVVDDLLDVSRVLHGAITIAPTRVELSTAVARALEVVSPIIQERAQTLHIAPIEAGLAVSGDLVRLTQILSNLLDNAAKYTPTRGEIWLTLRRTNGEVEISVRDNGRGIEAEQLPHIFDFFRHTDHSLVRSSSGLGVGLGLVRRLVELHGGRIVARSAGLGLGAQFDVTLPAEVASLPAAVSDAGRGAGEEVGPRRGRRVLVVDDNVDSVTSLMLLLQTMGHEVERAFDGVEALEVAQRFGPDTVVLDIGLPRLNGYEVARRLRAQSDRHYRLIALTGWGQQEDRERAQAAGFDYHLVKPVDVDQLGRLLEADTAASLVTH
jgi:PAS domain S-box-containing protein